MWGCVYARFVIDVCLWPHLSLIGKTAGRPGTRRARERERSEGVRFGWKMSPC